jgi:methyl-accepting chemotaxis protein
VLLLNSIKQRLIVVTLAIVLSSFIFSNIINYYFIINNFTKEIEKQNILLAESISSSVREFISKAYKITEELAKSNDVISFDPKRQRKVINNSIERNLYFDVLYIQGTDGMQTAKTSGILGSRAHRWWFKKIMKEKKPFVSKSYLSLKGNIPVSSVFIPIYGDNELEGIFGSDIKLGKLQELVEKLDLGEGSHAYILDGEGVVIAHPDKEKVTQLYNYKTLKKQILVKDSNGDIVVDENGYHKTEIKDIKVPIKLREITNKALQGESGVAEYINNDGDKVISAYRSISLPGKSNNWAIITVHNKKKAMSFVLNTRMKNVLVGMVITILTLMLIYYMANKITTPLKLAVAHCEEMAGGDFTRIASEEFTKRKDEIGELARGFNKITFNMQDMVNSIKDLVENLSAYSEELSASAQEGNASIEATNQLIENMSASIEQISASAQEVSSFAQESLAQTEIGSENIHKTVESIEEINSVVKQTVEVINELDNNSQEIGQIVELINNIAEQTNLLALNAAIEAARAGEAGQGFAVVADEIRDLAEDTEEATTRIAKLVKNTQEQSKAGLKAIKMVKSKAEEGQVIAEETGKVFNKIEESSEETSAHIQQTAASTEKLADNSDEIMEASQNIGRMSEEVTNSSQELADMAQKLHVLVNKFRV